MDDTETAWLAGLLEGEGHFSVQRPTPGKTYPGIEIKMIDQDIIERVAVIFGVKIYVKPPEGKGYQTQYRARVRGSKAVEIMRLVYPYLGERRKAQIDRVLA